MWNLTSQDVQRAKEQARLRRAEVETRYAAEINAIDAEFADIETLERIAGEFALKNGCRVAEAAAQTAETAEPMEPAVETGLAGGNEGRPGSRWRFQLGHRPEDAASNGELPR